MYLVIKKKGIFYIMKKHSFLLLSILLVLSVVFINSSKVEAAKSVKLNKTKLVLEMNKKETLKLLNLVDTSKYDSTEEAEAAAKKIKVKWSTSSKKVVKVSKSGVLTPVAVGEATVTAKVKGKSYKCKVTVIDYTGMSNEQKAVISYALKYVGNKYKYGGTSLTKGADCSGFTLAVYKKFGYKLYHNAYRQMVDVKSVKMKDIQPGDLIFYGKSKKSCSHVAMYIGNKKVVHASCPATGIKLSDYKYRKYVAVGRVLKTATYQDGEGQDVPDSNNNSNTAYAVSK